MKDESNVVGEADENDPSSWKLHVKTVPRIKVEALHALSSTSATSKEKWRRAAGWLNDPTRYASVPLKSANGAPAARMSDEHVRALEEYGVVAPCRKSEVSGWVKMFLVPEAAKKRWRPIKHTFVANEALGKESLQPCPLPSKSDKQALKQGKVMSLTGRRGLERVRFLGAEGPGCAGTR